MYLHSAELAWEKAPQVLWRRGGEKNYPWMFPAPRQSAPESLIRSRAPPNSPPPFGTLKLSGSDRECKYFAVGMNAREP